MAIEVLDPNFIASSGPAVCSWGPGRLDVFAGGKDSALWWNSSQGGKWSGWLSLGGHIASVGSSQVANPAAVSWGPNRIDVFVRGSDNHLQHKYWNGSSWSGWESLGETLTTGPGACSWGDQRLDVFWGGKNNALWHKSWDGGSWPNQKVINPTWSKAESLAGVVTSDPAAVAFQSIHPGDNLESPPSFRWMHVFVRSTDKHLWHRPWTWQTTLDPKKPSTGWGDWESRGGDLTSLAGSLAAGPGACVWEGKSIYVFVGGPNNQPQANALWGTAWKNNAWNPWSEFHTQLSADPDAVMSQADHMDVVTRAPNGTIWHTTLPPQ